MCTDKINPCLKCFFRGFKVAYMHGFSIKTASSYPFLLIWPPTDAGKAAGISFRNFSVNRVSRFTCGPKIRYTVVRSYLVYMIYKTVGKVPEFVKPRESMCKVKPPINLNAEIPVYSKGSGD